MFPELAAGIVIAAFAALYLVDRWARGHAAATKFALLGGLIFVAAGIVLHVTARMATYYAQASSIPPQEAAVTSFIAAVGTLAIAAAYLLEFIDRIFRVLGDLS